MSIYSYLISGVIALFIYLLIKTIYTLLFKLKGHIDVVMDQPLEIGDWQQLSVLGSGAFGTVMLWCNREKSDFIAIKKCKFQKESALSAKHKERWHLEVDFMKSINHPNVIAYKKLDPILEEMINKFNPTKLPLLSMEYCRKGNLRRYLTNEPIKLCGLQEYDVRCVLEDISSGLNYLHMKNITHRDIKPDNIVLQHSEGRKGETLYKIIDLGYAKELHDSTLSFVGTLHYLAPEIFYSEDYTNTVDYWSFGIMIFEIICGVLPFLPELTPFERYEKIKDKASDDICIYLAYSGSVTNTAELRKEHFVSSCFKRNIESWLQRVLQFDSANRTFSNDLSAFEHIRYILDKKIVQVFSVYKLEFYSYEINDGTQLGTLKNWISRDIKVNKNDFLILFQGGKPKVDESGEKHNVWYCNNDETLVETLLYDEDAMIYVYRRDAIVSDKFMWKVPNLVKELFNANFQLKFARQLYRQALFYVYSELQVVEAFKTAYFSYIKYLQVLCESVNDKYIVASEKLGLLIKNVEDFLEKKKSWKLECDNNYVDLSTDKGLLECLKYSERLLSSVERREENLKDFGKQSKVLKRKGMAIEEAKEKIESFFISCDLRSQFDKMNGKGFLEKQNGETSEVILKKIKDVISETTKLKCNLFLKNNDLKNYSKDFCYLLKSAEQLVVWVDDFICNIEQLSNDFSALAKRHEKIVLEALNNKKREFGLNFNQEEALQIIEENKLLRCQFEDILSKSVLAHKNFVEDSSAFIISSD